MRLVANWQTAWRWFSVQAIALAAIWEGMPLDAKAVIPDPYGAWVTLVLLVAAGLGRMVDQGTAK
jgi:hypothetical protein